MTEISHWGRVLTHGSLPASLSLLPVLLDGQYLPQTPTAINRAALPCLLHCDDVENPVKL